MLKAIGLKGKAPAIGSYARQLLGREFTTSKESTAKLSQEYIEDIITKTITKNLHERARLYGFHHSEITDPNTNTLKVKLFGECSTTVDNSYWTQLSKASKLKDLELSSEDLLLLLTDISVFLGLNRKETLSLFEEKISENQLETVDDITKLFTGLNNKSN